MCHSRLRGNDGSLTELTYPMTIETIFPQIARIVNADLRGKVVQCWKATLKEGGWGVSDLETIPFSLLAGKVDVSLAAHTRNVTDCSLALGEVLSKAYDKHFQIDFDVLTAGAILHDVGKPLEYCRNAGGEYVVSESGKILRHPISGCALAARFGLPETVQHIIAVHSREGDGGWRSPEAWIVHHSDFVNFEPLRQK